MKTAFFALAACLGIVGCGGSSGGSAALPPPTTSLIANGSFEVAFRSMCTVTMPHTFSYPAAPLFWVMNIGAPGATATTEILPSQAPLGSGTMTRFYTDQGINSTYNGAALAQYLPATTNVRFECDIKVLQGTVMLGPVQTSGPFYSQTTYGPNGQWRHIVIDCPVSTESVAFQNVGAINEILEFYVDNVKLYHP